MRSLFARRRSRASYALHELDLRLAEFLPQRGGVFVEAGANDGVAQSNTLWFERHRGWTGLLVEAVPALAAACRKNRPGAIVEEAALVPFGYAEPTIAMRVCGLMSLVHGAMGDEARERDHVVLGAELQGVEPHELTVPAVPLSALLDRHGLGAVDLLSLDVEGFEAPVLRGLDLERHAPGAILVEAWDRPAVEAALGERYEAVAELTEHGREVRGRPMAGDVLYLRR